MIVVFIEDVVVIILFVGCEVELFVVFGVWFEVGVLIFEVRGLVVGLLCSWKVVQILIEIWFGVVSDICVIVEVVRVVVLQILIVCMCKNVLGMKCFVVVVVKVGGVVMYWLGLLEIVFVFLEYCVFFGMLLLF